jgi:hypothetical protein
MVRIQHITFTPDFNWEIEQSAEELAADFALDADPYLDETPATDADLISDEGDEDWKYGYEYDYE